MIAVPLVLTTIRLVLGPLAIVFALTQMPHFVYAPLLLLGMLSDIFDGVIARKLGVVSPKLRRFDSTTDIIFYTCIFVTTCLVVPAVVRKSIIPLVLLAGSEVACLVISFIRFRSLPATHCYSAKVYGLVIFLAFFGVLALHVGSWAFSIFAVVGLIANTEVIAILLLSNSAPVDVLSVFRLKRKVA